MIGNCIIPQFTKDKLQKKPNLFKWKIGEIAISDGKFVKLKWILCQFGKNFSGI